jgi:hypothetical protein
VNGLRDQLELKIRVSAVQLRPRSPTHLPLPFPGLNPNLWFNNVELVAAKRVGRETLTYVSNI